MAIVCTAVVICRLCRTPAYSYSKLGTSEYGDTILMNKLKTDASQKSLLQDHEYHDDLSVSGDRGTFRSLMTSVVREEQEEHPTYCLSTLSGVFTIGQVGTPNFSV
ncbi:hypothetical protein Bbelb_352170 [Branchiostoma belcheri]|nr:hypothetical protein Bbelb_352170 [Branchiostoma belcheri]